MTQSDMTHAAIKVQLAELDLILRLVKDVGRDVRPDLIALIVEQVEGAMSALHEQQRETQHGVHV